MPSVNVYYKDAKTLVAIKGMIPELKEFCAVKLSCKEFSLDPGEVSIRLIPVIGDGMIGSMEVEIFAYNFEERAREQDRICDAITRFVEEQAKLQNIKTWLNLTEMGHG